ncbi:glycosyl transferase [Altererythrobacter sp. B11]|uniref:glycosyltransferase family 4 protein n=1 Tax=Altererythrobacter sp. B11 TaxID=2060312 RepID=UPI000DC6E82F|nr:glycosyltransferase family 4 protein [Altererythrobacter sp. B11]BBC73974.1 glycosyl transferase [Altererythrobacter sp. B11]
MDERPKIAVFANSAWYVYNFRLNFIEKLRLRGFEILLLTPPGRYADRLTALGFRCEHIALQRRSLLPWRELALVARLAKVLRHERVDLIHGFTIKCAIYGSLAGRVSGVTGRVGAVTGLGYVFSGNTVGARALRPFVRLLLKASMSGKNFRLIVQNVDDAAVFGEQHLVDNRSVRIIRGSGVDCRRFRPPTRRTEGDAMTVLLAARLLWQKGISEYADAARKLRADGHTVRFLLAGEIDPGNPNSVDAGSMSTWQEDGLFTWLGHVDDMASLLGSVDVVVLPSYYGEGLPKSLLEAAASGCALVATDMPGCREIVEHEKTGLLVRPRDSIALSSAILRLRDPDLRRTLGDAARRKAAAEFSDEVVFERTLEVYGELLPLLSNRRASVAPRRCGPTRRQG